MTNLTGLSALPTNPAANPAANAAAMRAGTAGAASRTGFAQLLGSARQGTAAAESPSAADEPPRDEERRPRDAAPVEGADAAPNGVGERSAARRGDTADRSEARGDEGREDPGPAVTAREGAVVRGTEPGSGAGAAPAGLAAAESAGPAGPAAAAGLAAPEGPAKRVAPGRGTAAALTAPQDAAVGADGRGDTRRAAVDAAAESAPSAAAATVAAAPTTTLARGGGDIVAAASAATAGAAPAAAAPPASDGGAAARPGAEATLAAAPGSAGFATELAARVSTFVRDGIGHARLHLNPAEMGPVDVRIQLDGDAARVMLAAEQAPTRQWLEQALPALAGSLREAGLTLAGGGVFERGGSGGGGAEPGRGDGAPAGRGAARDGSDAAALPAALPRRRGVVDLVA
jgi:flagellar hook-length control protein FliK